MKINYQRTYSIGPYLTEKIGFEVEYETADPVKEVEFLKTMCDEAHKRLNPHLETNVNEYPNTDQTIKVVQREKPIDAVAVVIADIETVTELKVLESYKFIAKTNEKVQEAFDKKLQSLQNKQ